MDNKETVFELIAQRKPWHSLPGALYSSEGVYRQDLEQIWHKDWFSPVTRLNWKSPVNTLRCKWVTIR